MCQKASLRPPRSISKMRYRICKNSPPLMAKLTKDAALLDEKVYEYLQQYAHGLLEFGALKPFSGAVDQLVFDKLFADFTGDPSSLTPITPKKQSFKATLKSYIDNPKLQEKADIDHQFTRNTLPGIMKPTKAELITVKWASGVTAWFGLQT